MSGKALIINRMPLTELNRLTLSAFVTNRQFTRPNFQGEGELMF